MTPTMSTNRKEAGSVDFIGFPRKSHFMWRLLEALKNKDRRKAATFSVSTFVSTFYPFPFRLNVAS